ncbi:MAG: hypothetical protein M3N49_05780 [Candidatus Eremiobacteraeota bacterium]|nr:hypothetical protein [Candidatus Eremiobacteraeota bacterium]
MAKFIIHSLRQLVMLEVLHDEFVDFRNDRAFTPLPHEERLVEIMQEGLREEDGVDGVVDDDAVGDEG